MLVSRSKSRSARVVFAVTLAARLGRAPLLADDWLQFGGNPQHSGNNPAETILSRANVGRLRRVFRAQLPDGADGAPAYLSGVLTPKGRRDLLFVTLAPGGVSAVDARTGEVVWTSHRVLQPWITTSCPAVDPNRQYVYGWSFDGTVHRYRVGDGVEDTGNGWPALVSRKPDVEKCSSCLAIATARSGKTYLYAATSSFGDAGNYQGHITAIDLATGAQRVFNAACSEIAEHLDGSGVMPSGCPDAGMGIWARSGVVYDPVADRILLTAANGAFRPSSSPIAWGDSVLALAPDGSADRGRPLDSYTPVDHERLGALDLDLGSTAVAILPTPSGRPRLGVQGGKDGVLRLIDLDRLGGTGAPGAIGGEVFRVDAPGNPQIFSAPAVWTNPADGGVFAYVPTSRGLLAYRLTYGDSGGPSLVLAWKDPRTFDFSSAMVANGIVYAVTTGLLLALDAGTGESLFETVQVGSIHMQSPIVVNGVLYLIADRFGMLDAYALDGQLPSAGESWVVASAAHLAGANGSYYTTDLTVANTTSEEMLFSLRFAESDADGTTGPVASFLLGPGATAVYDDVVLSVFGRDANYGAIHVTAPRPGLVIEARTATPGAGGTFGQGIAAVSSAFLQKRGAERSIPGAREDDAFRTNLVLASGSTAPLQVDVSAVGPDGAPLAAKSYTLPPLGMTQVSRVLRDLGITRPLKAARLVVSTTSDGGFTAYASLIDNATNDPSVLLAR